MIGFFLATSLAAAAADVASTHSAQLIRSKGEKIQGLEFETLSCPVIGKSVGEVVRLYAKIKIRVKDMGSRKLIVDSRSFSSQTERTALPSTSNGSIEFQVPIYDKVADFAILSIDALGKVEKERFRLELKQFDQLRDKVQFAPQKRFFISPGLGLTMVSYTETLVSNTTVISETALTAKLFASYFLVPRQIDLGGSVYLTTNTLSVKGPEAIRFFGLNLRMGYVVPRITEPWRVSLMAGYFYSTTMVSSGTFGYYGVSGPQIYPVIRRILKRGDSVSAYFKFSPLKSGWSLLNLTNRELAAGASYGFTLRSGNSISVGLDYSNIRLNFVDTDYRMNSSATTVGVSYTF